MLLDETEIKESESNPPQYYNESTIVKKLESSGVGRPSTYASIVSTLYNRNYTVVVLDVVLVLDLHTDPANSGQ